MTRHTDRVTTPRFELHDGLFVPHPTSHAPWSTEMLHGRLIGGLAARAIEAGIDHDTMRVARLTVDLFRRRTLERQYLEALASLPEAAAPSEEERALVVEALMEVDAMLANLGARVRKAFLLSQLEGLTYQQIADQLGVSLRTIKGDMAKAMEHCCLYRLEHGLQ